VVETEWEITEPSTQRQTIDAIERDREVRDAREQLPNPT
jgi:hypothetical protein